MEGREKLYELLLDFGISEDEISKRKKLEKDNMIYLKPYLINLNDSEVQYLFHSLKNYDSLGTFICLRPFLWYVQGNDISYWQDLKLILDNEYWKKHPFTINFLDIYRDLSKEERTKYIQMQLTANKDTLKESKIKPHTDRIQPITQDYYDVYRKIGMLEAYNKDGISLYDSLQVQNYQVAYYIHEHALDSEISRNIIIPLIDEILESMSKKQLNKTFEFNKENGILSYFGAAKERETIYESSLQYIKLKRQ